MSGVDTWRSGVGASLLINRISINHADLVGPLHHYKHKIPVNLIADRHLVMFCVGGSTQW